MDRRNIILAQVKGTKPTPPVDPVLPTTPLAPVPPPTPVQKGVDGNAMFGVYNGASDVIPPLRNYTPMSLNALGAFLGQLVPSGPDQAELSLLAQRAQAMTTGSSDQIRVTTLNQNSDGDPGLVQIVRLR